MIHTRQLFNSHQSSRILSRAPLGFDRRLASPVAPLLDEQRRDGFPFLLGHEAAARAWLEGPNTDLGARPVELIRSAEGLVRVVHYLDAHRGRV